MSRAARPLSEGSGGQSLGQAAQAVKRELKDDAGAEAAAVEGPFADEYNRREFLKHQSKCAKWFSAKVSSCVGSVRIN